MNAFDNMIKTYAINIHVMLVCSVGYVCATPLIRGIVVFTM